MSDHARAGGEGQEVHACCAEHRSAAGAAPAAAPAAAGAREWICPMHPEVVSDRPGSCPKCGMALEPRVVALDDEPDPELVLMTRRFWWCVVFTLPLLALAMGEMVSGHAFLATGEPRTGQWVQLALATPVATWGAWPFYVRGWRGARARSPNMFTLIALGVLVSYGYSAVATIVPAALPAAFTGGGHGGVYFEAAAAIVTLVLLGQVLELRARGRTGDAIRALLRLAPATARRVRDDGHDEEVPLAELRAGDRIRVLPGQRVPADGVVEDGRSAIDESMVTGEPIPVAKARGDRVIGGTVNGTGQLVVRAEQVGADTVLARIVQMVGEAQRSRAPIQRIADEVATWFVPAVIAIAAVTFAVWVLVGPEPRFAFALVNAVSVLIIACPCALGLATPMSIMVAAGKGATSGVLFRDAEAIETLRDVDALVVDKTGTLTRGRPELVAADAFGSHAEEDVLRLAAGLERASEHPLAAAVVHAARTRGLEPAAVGSFTSVTGMGVVGDVDGHRVVLGNAALLEREGIAPGEAPARAEALRADSRTVIFVAVDGAPAALLAFADPIKETTPEAVRALQAGGMHLVLATGDNPGSAAAVARSLGIDEVHAEARPEDKARLVEQLRGAGRTVAMAGDGVNDAPALAAADVGIAMGSGADVAIESAGVTLMQSDLRAVLRARRLSVATVRNIRQNLLFAFGYNALGLPIAAGALYPFTGLLLSPMLAAAAMTFSSVSVIANALRLRGLRLG